MENDSFKRIYVAVLLFLFPVGGCASQSAAGHEHPAERNQVERVEDNELCSLKHGPKFNRKCFRNDEKNRPLCKNLQKAYGRESTGRATFEKALQEVCDRGCERACLSRLFGRLTMDAIEMPEELEGYCAQKYNDACAAVGAVHTIKDISSETDEQAMSRATKFLEHACKLRHGRACQWLRSLERLTTIAKQIREMTPQIRREGNRHVLTLSEQRLNRKYKNNIDKFRRVLDELNNRMRRFLDRKPLPP